MLLQTQGYQSLFAAKVITIVFTTFVGQHRLEQMREWTRAELASTNEPRTIGSASLFATFTRPLEPRQLLLEPCWYTPYGDQQPMSLLAEV